MVGWGGHNKLFIAISANGMKHLLAHVPDQGLVGWDSSRPSLGVPA